jgi:hypothetical protein
MFAALLFASVSVSRAQEKDDNLLTNASFGLKLEESGLPMGWHGLYSQPPEGYRFSVVDTGHNGKRSLQITGKGKFGVVSGPRAPVDRALRYRASAWIKIEGEENSAADVKFHYFNKEGRYIDQSRVTFITPATKGWHQLQVVDQLELFPDAAEIQIAVAVAGNADAWFDGLSFTAKKEARPAVVNMTANGDMEDIVADRVAGWGAHVAAGGKVTGVADDKVMHGGKRSLHLTGSGEWISGGSALVRVVRGKECTLTAFAKSKKGRPNIGIIYMKDGEFLGATLSDELPTSDEWQTLKVTAKLEDFPTATHFGAICGGKEELDAWFDDFVFSAK